jgi:transposase InsO family protein
MICRYSQYGWSKKSICQRWGMSIKTFYAFKPGNLKSTNSRRLQLNTITPREKITVRDYALSHSDLRHREMAYKMIDEDIVYLSPSSVYRILRSWSLIPNRTRRNATNYWNPHQDPGQPDKIWQSDLTYIHYRGKSYYLVLFLDVYSRFIVHWQLCTQMTGVTVTYAFQDALRLTGQHPILQTDNGSCYLSHEFKSLLSKENIEHHLIHPNCPNENAEIERVNRTIKEDLYPEDADSFEQLNRIVKERINYYNYKRYHSGIGFITPYTRYRGNPEEIFEERKQKLERAKAHRIKTNWIRLKTSLEIQENKHVYKSMSYPKKFENV